MTAHPAINQAFALQIPGQYQTVYITWDCLQKPSLAKILKPMESIIKLVSVRHFYQYTAQPIHSGLRPEEFRQKAHHLAPAHLLRLNKYKVAKKYHT